MHQGIRNLLLIGVIGELFRHHKPAVFGQRAHVGKGQRLVHGEGKPLQEVFIFFMQLKVEPVVIEVRFPIEIVDIRMGGEQQGSVRGYFGYPALAFQEASGLDEEQEVIVKAFGVADVHGSFVHGIVAAHAYCDHGVSPFLLDRLCWNQCFDSGPAVLSVMYASDFRLFCFDLYFHTTIIVLILQAGSRNGQFAIVILHIQKSLHFRLF